MKRLKFVWLRAIVLILAVTLLLGSFNVFAHAADENIGGLLFEGNVVKRVRLGSEEGFDIPAPKTGVLVSVKSPEGTELVEKGPAHVTEAADLNYSADVVGIYTVKYTLDSNGDGKDTDESVSYSFNVYCYSDTEYELKVFPNKDTFLPTYVKTGTDIDIPDFALGYTNAKGKFIDLSKTAGKVEYSVDCGEEADPTPKTASTGKGFKVKPKIAHTMTVRLKAKLVGTSKTYSKDFTINVQNDFEDTTAPRLSTVSVATTANINTLVNLPKATATDNYDAQPYVIVKVVDPEGNDVIEYEADENGFAKAIENAQPVAFNNDDVIGFYPTYVKDGVPGGTYTVTYQAIDSSDNKSAIHTYYIDVKDNSAPTIKNVNSDLIPTEWGRKTVKKDKDTVNNTFTIPFPDIIDNYSNKDNITLDIRLIKPESGVIIKWVGKVSEFESATGVKVSNDYTTEMSPSRNYLADDKGKGSDLSRYNFKSTGLTFSFSDDYLNWNNSYISRYKTGAWTIQYMVMEGGLTSGSGNSRKTFIVNLKEALSDPSAPEIKEPDLPKYFIINDGGETYTAPIIRATDVTDGDLTIGYSLISKDKNNAEVGVGATETITVKEVEYKVLSRYVLEKRYTGDRLSEIGGDVFKVVEFNGTYYLTITRHDKDYAIKLAAEDAKIEIEYYAIDDVGFRTDLKKKLEDNSLVNYSIDFLFAGSIDQTSENKKLAPNMGGLDFTGDHQIDSKANKGSFYLGSFYVENIGFPEYTGFEISILDKDDKAVELSVYSYYVPVFSTQEGKEDEIVSYTLVVRNLKASVSEAGTHKAQIRIFDISGQSMTYVYSFEVTKKPGNSTGPVSPTAAEVGSNGYPGTTYELKTDLIAAEGSKYVRKIEGKGFALVGSLEFTGLNVHNYVFTDYALDITAHGDMILASELAFLEVLTEGQVYTLSVGASSDAPADPITGASVIAVINGELESPHTAKRDYSDATEYKDGEFYDLPIFMAYNMFENIETTVTASYTNGNTGSANVDVCKKVYFDEIDKIKTFDKEHEDEDGVKTPNTYKGYYAISVNVDGTYTITVEAKPSLNVRSTTATFKLLVGDIIKPTFDVTNKVTSAMVDDYYKRAIVTNYTDNSGTVKNIKIALYHPNGKILEDKDYTYSTYGNSTSLPDADKIESDITFDTAGTYRVEIKVFDEAGNWTLYTYDIVVTGTASKRPWSTTILTTVLIIAALLLLAGVIVYVVRFKVKPDDGKKRTSER